MLKTLLTSSRSQADSIFHRINTKITNETSSNINNNSLNKKSFKSRKCQATIELRRNLTS